MGRRRTVSVVLTSCDRYDLLRLAVESVYAQTFRNWELLIADDSSSDPRVSKLYKEISSDPYVEICGRIPVSGEFRESHKMIAVRINQALRHASGKYIAYLADDNVWFPGRLESVISCFEPSIGIVVDEARWITWDGRTFPQDRLKYRYREPFESGHEQLLKMIAPSNYIVHDCAVHRKVPACQMCNEWPTDNTDTPVDWRYWLKLISKQEYKVKKINEVGVVAYVPGTWKHATVKQAMAHRPELTEVLEMNRRQRIQARKNAKKENRNENERYVINTSGTRQQIITNGKPIIIEKGERVSESLVRTTNGIFPGFTYESREVRKPIEEVLAEKPAEVEDFAFDVVEDEPVAPEKTFAPEPEETFVPAPEEIDSVEKSSEPKCKVCGGPVSAKSKTGMCRSCYNESRRKK